jgi:hypothetical protein
MPNVAVKLTTPIQAPEGEVTQIVLREPKYLDVVQLGEPSAFARSEGGMIYQAERDGVVQGYIERLLFEPKDPQLLLQLSLADTLKLKEAVFGFFAAAREAIST